MKRYSRKRVVANIYFKTHQGNQINAGDSIYISEMKSLKTIGIYSINEVYKGNLHNVSFMDPSYFSTSKTTKYELV